MKRTEKTDKILAKYKQYLKLEKSLSTNTVEAYLTDLDKLMAYLTLENLHPLEVTLEHLETFSAGLRDIGIHPPFTSTYPVGHPVFFLSLSRARRLSRDRPDRAA